MNNTIPDVADVVNLAQFAKRSGIPLRTLQRIKAKGSGYPMSATTRIALKSAFSRCKPEMKEKK